MDRNPLPISSSPAELIFIFFIFFQGILQSKNTSAYFQQGPLSPPSAKDFHISASLSVCHLKDSCLFVRLLARLQKKKNSKTIRILLA